MSEKRGLFITFEGGEGSGKTTQINKIAALLTKEGHKVITTREPGGTAEGDKIRELLVQRDGGQWSPAAEVLLLYAARAVHVDKIIKPALENAKIVISDRFTDSTIAYQGYGHGFSIETIKKIDGLVLNGFKPDMTFILDIDPAAGLKRSERRLAAEELRINQSEDRFENMDLDFHKRLRQGFMTIAEEEPGRCHVIDAELETEEITEHILKRIRQRLN